MSASVKAAEAFRTIGEVTEATGVPAHVLRYWETRFPQLRPVQRAGNRRHYRPDDVALVRRLDALLNHEGYTIRGVQLLLAREAGEAPARTDRAKDGAAALRRIRDSLARALADDA